MKRHLRRSLILGSVTLAGVALWLTQRNSVPAPPQAAQAAAAVPTQAVPAPSTLPQSQILALTGAQTKVDASVPTVVMPSNTKDTVANTPGLPYKKLSKAARFEGYLQLEWERTHDPATGEIPKELREKAFEQTRRMQGEFVARGVYERNSILNAKWVERGPGNVGGRTRAMLVDLNDPTGNTVFAAGVAGGVFKTSNMKSNDTRWERINDWLPNLSASSIAQDPRNPNIMYIGTGDSDGNDTRGLGLFKSVDGGKTWNLLESTNNGSFLTTASLLVTPDSSIVYAGTTTGVYKSTDQGATWRRVFTENTRGIFRASDGRLYLSTNARVFRSTQAGESGTWVNASTGFPTSCSRVEIAVAPSNPDVVYMVGSINNAGTGVYKTTNGGVSWTLQGTPSWIDGCSGAPVSDWTRGQAWYDLTIIVDRTNPNVVWIGGVDLFRSLNGGVNWTQASDWARCSNTIQYAHADHHGLIQDPFDAGTIYAGTDGGVFRISNMAGAFAITEKTVNYITTQFYACAIHPDSAVNHFIAGAQDNGTLIVRSQGVGFVNGRSIGGDGFMCHIDQNQPNLQIGSLYNGIWFLSTNGGESFSRAANSNGNFFTPSDYDNVNNVLYAQTRSGDIWRWRLGDNSQQTLDIAGFTTNAVSHIYVDENKSGRVYVASGGRLVRVDNAVNAASLTGVSLGTFSGTISSVDVEEGDTNHIIIAVSNYNVQSVYESRNGGLNWQTVEGNLPNMPVRWAMFNPNDGRSAILATETGVWATNLLNGTQTVWTPPVPSRGTPLVRTDMLQYRKSDKMALAATFGRGMWTSSMFSKPQAQMAYEGITYVGATTRFYGEVSNAADTYRWTFSDGTTDTVENPVHVFQNVGTYDVSLTINGDNNLTVTGKIKVLPNLPTPYTTATSGYEGGVETTDIHFGTYSLSGSKFERGVSTVQGKNGVHNGQSAYVLGKTEQIYQPNTTAYLYTPSFDMSAPGIYQFSFWSIFDIQRGFDGMQVEYSLDKGITWNVLGSSDEPNWYNFRNNAVQTGAFPLGTSYFSGTTDDWTQFKVNISQFAGNRNVAFRFAFKSDRDNANGAGVVIDDILLTRYQGVLATQITAQSGAFTKAQTSIDVKFQTQPEYFAKGFTLEMSKNGREYDSVAFFRPTGVTSADLQEYTYRVNGTPLDFYYFRIKSYNENVPTNYSYNFINTPFIVKRLDVPPGVNKVFPSPFTNFIGVTFTDIINSEVTFNLYDVLGRLVSSEKVGMNGVYHEFRADGLAKGIYLLEVKIGENKSETFKLFGGS